MAKIRLIRTTVIEYDVEPEYYPDGYTLEQMAELDANSDDPEALFSDNVISDKIDWEVVK